MFLFFVVFLCFCFVLFVILSDFMRTRFFYVSNKFISTPSLKIRTLFSVYGAVRRASGDSIAIP